MGRAEIMVDVLKCLGIAPLNERQLRSIRRPRGKVCVVDHLEHAAVVGTDDRQGQVLLEKGNREVSAVGAPGQRQGGQVGRPRVELVQGSGQDHPLVLRRFLDDDLEPRRPLVLEHHPAVGQRPAVRAPARRGERPPGFLEQDRFARFRPARPDPVEARSHRSTVATPPDPTHGRGRAPVQALRQARDR